MNRFRPSRLLFLLLNLLLLPATAGAWGGGSPHKVRVPTGVGVDTSGLWRVGLGKGLLIVG